MKRESTDKGTTNLSDIFIVLTILGLITIFFIQIKFMSSLSFFVYVSWTLFCVLLYSFINKLTAKNTSEFDFYKVAEPVGRKERRRKKNIEERVGIYIDEDGLDPMVLFNEEKSGVSCILKFSAVALTHQFSEYFSQLGISVKAQGRPIAGQKLMDMSFQEQSGYYRLSTRDTHVRIELAFHEKRDLIYNQVTKAVTQLKKSYPDVIVKKIDVTNFQAMQKFYHYVQRLSAPENRSIEYMSYCDGTLKICNSSYVALYDCTLQSTLTSWVNQDGIIRSDNVDVEFEEDNLLHLVDIELPYPECRLTNIQIVKVDNPQEVVKLCLTLAELDQGELTDNVSTLTLVMKGNSISITSDTLLEESLISVKEYFEQKSYPPF